MTEWQIIESDNFPESSIGESARPARHLRRHWLWVLGGILLLLVGVGAVLRWRLSDRNNVLRTDLEATILEEETLRYLGQPEKTAITSNTPPEWKRAYWQSFESGTIKTPPGIISITDLDFDGRCATVTINLDNAERVRAYCLSSQGWHRAQVLPAVWGDEPQVIFVGTNIELHFLPRDQLFAETLANDLSRLLDILTQHNLVSETLPNLKINITPQDLNDPLITNETGQIVVNSPWLTPFQLDTGLSGEAAVRLALGEDLLRQFSLVEQNVDQRLPGAGRFAEAAQFALVAQVLLSPEAQSQLLDSWVSQLDSQWASLFFVGVPQPSEATTSQMLVAAQIIAHAIQPQGNGDALASVLEKMPTAVSWDDLFQETVSLTTIELEREAAAVALARRADLELPAYLSDNTPTPDLPLTGTLAEIDNAPENHVYMTLPNRAGPLLVSLPTDPVVYAPDGNVIPLGCVGLEKLLEIDGEWLEQPQRFGASRVVVRELSPLPVNPASADTVAYLLTGTESNPDAFVALDNNGTLQMLSALNASLRVHSLPVVGNQPPHFLFEYTLPTCNGIWYLHYNPAEGITQQWLAPPDATQWVWRADQQDLILFNGLEETYNFYLAKDGVLPKVISHSSTSQKQLGWNTINQQLVSHVLNPDGNHLALVDVNSGAMQRRAYYLPLRGRTLAPNGEWLAYLASSINVSWPPNRLELINLIDESFEGLMTITVGDAFLTPVWSPNPEKPLLAVLTGPVEGNNSLPTPVRLVIASPNSPGSFQDVAIAAPDEQFASPVFCGNGKLLYRSELNGQYRLIRQAVGEKPETLFDSSQSFEPFACP